MTSRKELATWYKINPRTLTRLLKKHGIELEARHLISNKELERIRNTLGDWTK